MYDARAFDEKLHTSVFPRIADHHIIYYMYVQYNIMREPIVGV